LSALKGTKIECWQPQANARQTNRIEALEALVTRASLGLELSTDNASKSPKPILMPSLRCKVILGELEVIFEIQSPGSIAQRVCVPLLLSDVVSVACRDVPGDDNVRYVVGIAPRGASDDAVQPKLTEAWLLCLGGSCNDDDVQSFLFSISSRGALRWDTASSFEVHDRLGAGGYATVFRGKAKKPLLTDRIGEQDDSVAVKIFKESTTSTAQTVKTEVANLCRCFGHPNITQFLGVFCSQTLESDSGQLNWIIVMEMCPHGDLFDFIDEGLIPADTALSIMAAVFSALEFIHGKNLVHRDVKAENILLSHGRRPVLADFGIAAFADDADAMTNPCGTPGYAAPEIITAKRYNQKVDIFAAGVVLYFMLSNKLPFSGKDLRTVIRKTSACKVKFDKATFGSIRSPVLLLVKALLEKDPRARPSAQDALAGCLMLLPADISQELSSIHSEFLEQQKQEAKETVLVAAKLPEQPPSMTTLTTHSGKRLSDYLNADDDSRLTEMSKAKEVAVLRRMLFRPGEEPQTLQEYAENADVSAMAIKPFGLASLHSVSHPLSSAISAPPESPTLISAFRRRMSRAGNALAKVVLGGKANVDADLPMTTKVTDVPRGSAVAAVKSLQSASSGASSFEPSPPTSPAGKVPRPSVNRLKASIVA
jgi:serine/threonine protein kinase